MSTSHYSNGNYEPIKSSNPHPALISPSRTDDYPEPWADRRSRSSIQHSRPEAGDVGAETVRMPLPAIKPKPKPVSATWLLLSAILLLVGDGAGLVYFCDNFWESVVFCCLTVPAGAFVIWCAYEIRITDKDDWNY
jgi:hypothetical protein